MMKLLDRRAITNLIAVTLVGLAVLSGGPQVSLGQSLWQKLRGYRAGQAAAERELKQVKARQSEAQTELVGAQQELEKAEARLRQVRRQLDATRQELEQTREELAQSKARLEQHQTATQQRLLVVYKGGQPVYLEVVLHAASFEDFTNRTAFTRRMAAADQDLLARLVAEKQAYERQKAQLEEKEREQRVLEAQLSQHRDEVKARKAEAERLARKTRTDRVTAERELAAMAEAAGDIERMLASLSSGGAGRYGGSWGGSLLRPVSGGRISSPFGNRRDPFTRTSRFHHGVDIAVPRGTPIRAADKGLVIHAGWYKATVYGRAVIVDHGSGIHTVYAHCSRVAVSSGAVVRRGQIIAYVGNSGRSTGPHLHFELRRQGRAVNPMRF